jgi:hypothetical protein
MSKDNKRKRIWQGMEHLKKQLETSEQSNLIDTQTVEKAQNSDFSVLKKELLFIIVIMSILFLALVGLMIYDRGADGLTLLAERIASILIK